MNGSLQVVKRLVEVLLRDADLSYLKQRITSQFLIRAPVTPLLRGQCVLDDLLEVKYSLIFMALFLEDLALVIVDPRVFVVFLKQLLEIDQTLLVVAQLIQQHSPLQDRLPTTSTIQLDGLVVGMKGAFKVSDTFHAVCLADVAGPVVGLEVDNVLEVDKGLLKLLQVYVDLAACLKRLHVPREPLDALS